MIDRSTVTTTWVRAEDLKHGDIAKIDGTWSFVREMYHSANLDVAVDDHGADSDMYRKIEHVVDMASAQGDTPYVAVCYLYTRVGHAPGPGYRYSPHDPSYQIAAYSQYELIEIQKEEK